MKREKPACTLLVAMLILGIVMVNVGAYPQIPKLFVDPPTYTASVLDEVFTIDINIANVQDLIGFEFKLGYNTTLLDAVNVTIGPFPPNPVPEVEINETEGYVWVLVLCSVAYGNGTLATITFKTTYAGSASCPLHLYDTLLGDIWGEPIDHDVEDGNYEFVILNITVATDKPSYYQKQNVEIHGNLTLEGSPYQGLVAVEVDDPRNYGIVRRTLEAGAPPPPGDITIADVFPCNKWGEPIDPPNFRRETQAYFNVRVRNNGTEWKNVAITVNAYDGNMVSLGAPTVVDSIGPGICSSVSPIFIPDWAYIGTGTVYASAFTDLPRFGGAPYCPEKSNTFNITSIYGTLGGTGQEPQVSGNEGNYSLTFKLPAHDLTAGNYTVYATSSYLRQQVINSTTFEVTIYGDVDGDGEVTFLDIKKVKLVIGGYIDEPRADVDGDGNVTYLDLKKVKLTFCCYLPLP